MGGDKPAIGMDLVQQVRGQDGPGRVLHGQEGKDFQVLQVPDADPLGDGRQQGRRLPNGHAVHQSGPLADPHRRLLRGDQLAPVFFRVDAH